MCFNVTQFTLNIDIIAHMCSFSSYVQIVVVEKKEEFIKTKFPDDVKWNFKMPTILNVFHSTIPELTNKRFGVLFINSFMYFYKA